MEFLREQSHNFARPTSFWELEFSGFFFFRSKFQLRLELSVFMICSLVETIKNIYLTSSHTKSYSFSRYEKSELRSEREYIVDIIIVSVSSCCRLFFSQSKAIVLGHLWKARARAKILFMTTLSHVLASTHNLLQSLFIFTFRASLAYNTRWSTFLWCLSELAVILTHFMCRRNYHQSSPPPARARAFLCHLRIIQLDTGAELHVWDHKKSLHFALSWWVRRRSWGKLICWCIPACHRGGLERRR